MDANYDFKVDSRTTDLPSEGDDNDEANEVAPMTGVLGPIAH